MASVIALARAHWPIPAALALGVLLGWQLFHPRQPAVHEVASEHIAEQRHDDVAQHVDEKPSHTVVAEKFACPQIAATPQPAGAVAPFQAIEPQLIERVTTIDRGEVVTDTRAVTDNHQQQDRRIDLTITPAPAPGWAVQAGLDDVLHARTLRIAARRRIVGPFWVELAVSPASRGVGVAGAVEW